MKWWRSSLAATTEGRESVAGGRRSVRPPELQAARRFPVQSDFPEQVVAGRSHSGLAALVLPKRVPRRAPLAFVVSAAGFPRWQPPVPAAVLAHCTLAVASPPLPLVWLEPGSLPGPRELPQVQVSQKLPAPWLVQPWVSECLLCLLPPGPSWPVPSTYRTGWKPCLLALPAQRSVPGPGVCRGMRGGVERG